MSPLAKDWFGTLEADLGEVKEDWFSGLRADLTNENAWGKVKDIYSWMYPKGIHDLPRQYGAALTEAGMAVGEGATWLARLCPEQENLPPWKEQDMAIQARTLAQAGSLVALGTLIGYTGISAIGSLAKNLAYGRADKIADNFAIQHYDKIKANNPNAVRTLADAKALTEASLRQAVAPAVETTYLPTTMRELTKLGQRLLQPVTKTVPTAQFKSHLTNQVATFVKDIAGKTPTQELMRPFVQTIEHYVGAPTTGLITTEYGQAVAAIISDRILPMFQQLKQVGKAVPGIDKVTAPPITETEEVTAPDVGVEPVEPLAKAPVGEAIPTALGLDHPVEYYVRANMVERFKTAEQFERSVILARQRGTANKFFDEFASLKFEEEFGSIGGFYDWVKGNPTEIMAGIKQYEDYIDRLPISEQDKIDWKEDPANFELNLQTQMAMAKPTAEAPSAKAPEELTLAVRNIGTGEITVGTPDEKIHVDMMPRLKMKADDMQLGWVDPKGKFYDIFSVRRTLAGPEPIEPGVPSEAPPMGFKPPIPPTPPPAEMPDFAAEPESDPVAKLSELIKKAKPIRKKLEKAYTAERAKRIGEVERFIDETVDTVGGEEGYRMILGKLKGELVSPEAKIKFEPVKDKLSEEELKALYVRTWKHPYLDNWEKVSAADGLTDLLMGGIPQPKKLVLLEEVYGSELVKELLKKRPWGVKAMETLVEAANVPRAALATADMSAFLRQGVIDIPAHPVLSAKAMAKTFEFAFKPAVFEQWFEDLAKHKHYPLMRKFKLGITDPSKAGMEEREEVFISRVLQRIPGIKIPVEFAERAYVGYLNKLRVDKFSLWVDELLSKGFTPTKNPELFKAAANVVNNFSGRGSLGKFDRITPELNTIFFSPRLIAARFNALNPIWYAKQPKEIRKKALGDFGKFVVAALTTLAAIKLTAGDKVSIETDPRSSDFGKIRIGDTRYDIWGGFQQWARVFTQLVMGQRKNTTTGEIVSLNKEEYPFTTRKEVLLRFIEGKLAPVPALGNELISGAKTFGGEDISLEYIAQSKFIPMYIQDITEAFEDGGLGRAVGSGIPAFFGVGVQTWKPRKKKPAKAYWFED